MTELATLHLPSGFDAMLIRELADLQNPWGYANSEDGGLILTFQPAQLDAVNAAVAAHNGEQLRRAKAARLEEISTVRAERLLIGPMGLRLDKTTMSRIAEAYLYLKEDTAVETVRWEVSRNVWQTMPRSMFVGETGLILLIGRYTQSVFTRSEILMGLIMSAETIDDVNAVNIVDEWPTWS